ncbi:MAG: aldehyde ferredoxin oxidoreductase C-terminal domain-containing protein [Vicinamibacterales bacterium]
MARIRSGSFGYQGRWAWVDLTNRTVRVEPADERMCRAHIGGRGLQAQLILAHLAGKHSLDPLGEDNRIVIGTGPLNDTAVATAGRASCSFISPLTRSVEPAPWLPGHEPLHGLVTHSSAGGHFPNMLKRAGFDQVIVDGWADSPVRLLASEGRLEILDAEDDLFEAVGGERVARSASEITDRLTALHPGSATMTLGPAGWNKVACACLTGDHHRNFGRGGAGAVFGSKRLVAVTAEGRQRPSFYDREAFERAARDLDERVRRDVEDEKATASFRPATGTTWWLDRAFDGGYRGRAGGYLPWHNFDEGTFDPDVYSRVGTEAFLEIAGRHKVCSRCRHVMCTRAAAVESGPWAGEGVRPEFETVALWINCCLADRDAIFHLNLLSNRLGLDTMTSASIVAAVMDLEEHGLLRLHGAPSFGDLEGAVRMLKAIAYRSTDLGRAAGEPADRMVAALSHSPGDRGSIAALVTTSFGGLGYAGIEPKVFPGMFLAYATSNRGRGDHTSAWTIQAEEGGLSAPAALAGYVAEAQAGKALVDSLGLCDFFPEDVASESFLRLHQALTGIQYTPEEMQRCGERIVNVERLANSLQGRGRAYDLYVPPKFTVPLTSGAHAGKAVDPAAHAALVDAYYARQGWTRDGIVPREKLRDLGITAGESIWPALRVS